MPDHNDKFASMAGLESSRFPEAFSDISPELQTVKDRIAAELATSVPEVDERLTHVTAAPGKMLRPALVLLSGKLTGKINETHIDIAAIIEIIHIATLLHDDVIDQAKQRRGQPTPSHIWGNESAVLLGDFLLSKAFAMAAKISDRKVSSVLAETAISICRGELVQNANRHNWRLTEEKYFEIIQDKTASLFCACCKLGAMASNADAGKIKNLSDFGLYTGISFQIADDLIDITGGKSEGKTLGRDIAESKATLPLIHLFETLDGKQADELIEEISSGNAPADYEQMLIDSGSIEYSRNLAKEYCQKALKAIENTGQPDSANHLKEITQMVLKRCG